MNDKQACTETHTHTQTHTHTYRESRSEPTLSENAFVYSAETPVCAPDGETAKENKCCFWAAEDKVACVFVGLCVFVCVCIREAAADRRALGDYGTGRGTITHRRPHRRPQTDRKTDRQPGWPECWWLTDRNPPPRADKERLSERRGRRRLGGKGIASFSHSNKQACTRAHAQGNFPSCSTHFVSFIQLMTHHITITLSRTIVSFCFPHKHVSKGTEAFLFNTIAQILLSDQISDNVYDKVKIIWMYWKSGHHCNWMYMVLKLF